MAIKVYIIIAIEVYIAKKTKVSRFGVDQVLRNENNQGFT